MGLISSRGWVASELSELRGRLWMQAPEALLQQRLRLLPLPQCLAMFMEPLTRLGRLQP